MQAKEEEPVPVKVAVAPQRRTRDQVTRHNTQRNSHIPMPKNTDTKSSNSSIDQKSSSSNNSTEVLVTQLQPPLPQPQFPKS